MEEMERKEKTKKGRKDVGWWKGGVGRVGALWVAAVDQ
jgi:hypothetical protein